jgi:hypothetical protein
LHRHVEPDGRLVEKEDVGPVQERGGKLAFHALPERQLSRGFLRDVGDAEKRIELLQRRLEEGSRNLVNGSILREGLGRRKIPDKLLLLPHDEGDALEKAVLAHLRRMPGHQHLARARVEETCQDFEGGGFACAVRTQKSHPFAGRNGER